MLAQFVGDTVEIALSGDERYSGELLRLDSEKATLRAEPAGDRIHPPRRYPRASVPIAPGWISTPDRRCDCCWKARTRVRMTLELSYLAERS